MQTSGQHYKVFRDLTDLRSFVWINAEGFRKIAKKYVFSALPFLCVSSAIEQSSDTVCLGSEQVRQADGPARD